MPIQIYTAAGDFMRILITNDDGISAPGLVVLEQIAQELDVAGTTIKTHIRNLYQKLNIANRKEAISTAENLLQLMGY